MTKKDIIKILMKRDDLTKEEATDIVNETQDLINEVVESEDAWEAMIDVENILADQLGLEPDYMMAFIDD